MVDINAVFTGAVPELYTRYLGPIFFGPYAADLASRLKGFASARLLAYRHGATSVALRAARISPS
jgi:hypothetical protein